MPAFNTTGGGDRTNRLWEEHDISLPLMVPLHGLKTPLAILLHEAERAGREGSPEWAAVSLQQIERMRRQIDYHLAQARAGCGATPGIRSSVRDSADALGRTLQRLYADRKLSFEIAVPENHFVLVRHEDLDEILGNLLDNACKWGKSRVRVSSAQGNGDVSIFVEDDSCGITPSLRERVLQRGVRTDESTPGSGLGLAMVRELVEIYGGSIALGESDMQGTKVSLRLPSAV